MRKILSVISVSFLLFGCAGLGPVSDQNEPQLKKQVKDVSQSARRDDSSPRKRLMILPFLDDSSNRPQEVRDKARTEFIKELNKTQQMVVLDSKDLKIDLSKSLQGGEYKMSDVAKEANALGVAAILEGKIIDLAVKRKSDEVGVFRQLKSKFECKARVRIFSARNGKELFNTLKSVTIEEANMRVAETVDSDRFFQANPEILQNLVMETFLDFQNQIIENLEKMSWEGRIAMISGDRVYLNVGRISGVQIGDVLKVSEEGDEVYDPQSGNYIGRVAGRSKGTLEVVSYFGQDGAIAVIHSGSGFKENDKVELY